MKITVKACRLCDAAGVAVDAAAIDRAIDFLCSCGLAPRECARLRAISGEAARRQSVGARLALVRALLGDASTVLDFDDRPTDVPDRVRAYLAGFDRQDTGAPWLCENLAVSLAHSNYIAVCAVSDRGAVGIDVEPLDRLPPRADRIAMRVFSDAEQQLLAHAPLWEREFLRLWTRKEALGKALGVGLRADAAALNTVARTDVCFFEQEVEGHLVTVCQVK